MFYFACYAFCSQAQDIPIEKFIGIWQQSQGPQTMKISQENGKIILQLKNFISGEAKLNGNRLEITVVNEVKYGKFQVGRWNNDSPNNILVGHSDGSYGTNGEVEGFFSESYRHSIANKHVSYTSVHVVYKYEGTLELYFTCYSTYYDGNIPIFYSGRDDDIYRGRCMGPYIFTNW